MKITAKVLLLTGILVGCSQGDPHLPGYKTASGNAVPFILESAVSFGARPVKTNDLGKLEAEWRYRADKDGIQIYLAGDRFPEVQSLLLEAFGSPAIAPKTNADGHVSGGVYAAPTAGAVIQFGREDLRDGSKYTHILVVKATALKP